MINEKVIVRKGKLTSYLQKLAAQWQISTAQEGRTIYIPKRDVRRFLT